MLLYLSGPITGYPNYNQAAFKHAEQALLRSGWGYAVINPAEHVVDGWEWQDYLRYDIAQMMSADGVAVLEGWEDSKGARVEVNLARDLCIPVMPWQEWVHPGPDIMLYAFLPSFARV